MAEQAEQVLAIASSLWSRLGELYRRHSAVVNTVVFFVVVLSLLLLLYDRYGKTNITILAGPAESAGARYADAVIAASDSSPLARLAIDAESTEGFEANREQIANDTTGRLIGFGHDGFGDSSNVRILVPLNSSHLHILCRREFYRDLELACCSDTARVNEPEEAVPPPPPLDTSKVASASPHCSACQPPTFYDIVYLYNNHMIGGLADRRKRDTRKIRFHLGPEKSGSRQVASSVLDHFRLTANDYHEVEAHDWRALLHKLRDGEVDIAFYVAPTNSPEIRSLAVEDNCFLVNLGEDAAAIAGDLDAPVSVTTIASHQYGRRVKSLAAAEPYRGKPRVPGDSAAGDGWVSLREPEFCESVKVLSTRRVLLCSREMDSQTAYRVGLLARQALSDNFSKLGWLSGKDDARSARFSFLLHPAAKLLRDEQPPPSNWMSFLEIVSVPLLLAIFLRVLYKSTVVGAQAAGGPSAEATGEEGMSDVEQDGDDGRKVTPPYLNIERMIEHLGCEIMIKQDTVVSRTVFNSLKADIGRIREVIRVESERGRLSDTDRMALEEGVARELENQLTRVQVKKSLSPSKQKGASKAS